MSPAVTALSAAERELFVSSARSALTGVWPTATSAGAADAGQDDPGRDGAGLIGRVWGLAAECGWFELGEAGDLQTALALAARTGPGRVPAAGTPRRPPPPHMLLPPGPGGTARVRAIAAVRPRAGLAVPAWCDLRLGEERDRLASRRSENPLISMITKGFLSGETEKSS